jgi:hypothetical protein
LYGNSYNGFSVDFRGVLGLWEARLFPFHLLRKVITKTDNTIPIKNGQKSKERPTEKPIKIGI